MACDISASPQIYRYYSTLSYIPIILCLVLLSLWYPALLIRSFTGQEETLDKEVMKIHGVTQGMVAWENPSMDLQCFQELSCPAAHLSALGTGRTGVLPEHVFLTLFQHRDLPPLHPSDGLGCGSVCLAGFEEGAKNPSLE